MARKIDQSPRVYWLRDTIISIINIIIIIIIIIIITWNNHKS